jgi:hypothetical protein
VPPDSYAVAAIEETVQRDSRPSPRLSGEESELLSQINSGLPEETWVQYDRLVERRRKQTLSAQEYEQLLQLTNAVEEDHARRIGLLGKLATIRNVPLEALMHELGIGPRVHGAEHDG